MKDKGLLVPLALVDCWFSDTCFFSCTIFPTLDGTFLGRPGSLFLFSETLVWNVWPTNPVRGVETFSGVVGRRRLRFSIVAKLWTRANPFMFPTFSMPECSWDKIFCFEEVRSPAVEFTYLFPVSWLNTLPFLLSMLSLRKWGSDVPQSLSDVNCPALTSFVPFV